MCEITTLNFHLPLTSHTTNNFSFSFPLELFFPLRAMHTKREGARENEERKEYEC